MLSSQASVAQFSKANMLALSQFVASSKLLSPLHSIVSSSISQLEVSGGVISSINSVVI